MRTPCLAIAGALAAGCGASSPPPPPSTPLASPAAPTPPPPLGDIALPGSTGDGIGMDYLLFDPRTHAVWVPAGNTGSVDVIDTGTGKLTRIEGFATREVERHGKKHLVGPSSAALGEGVVYIGNRGDSSVCAVDDTKLVKGACGTLDSSPDGIVYVAPTKEVWVSTPRDHSIRILDAATLAQKARISFDGDPEGYAVDATRGRFYTNLEDKDVTLAIDLASHAIVATWKSACGEDGPHGLRLAEPEGFLFIACSAKTETMDVGHDGAIVGAIDTGDGADDLDYVAATHAVYIGAGRVAKLTVARVDAKGALTLAASAPTKEGARNPVVDAMGRVYLIHGAAAELVVVAPTLTP